MTPTQEQVGNPSILEAIRAKIIEAVPEIVCEEVVVWKNKGVWYYAYADEKGLNQHSIGFSTKAKALGNAYGRGRYTCRPITLADVLRAMPDTEFQVKVKPKEGWVLRKLHGEGGLMCMWDLTKPYDDQEEEVKLFIGKLLGV